MKTMLFVFYLTGWWVGYDYLGTYPVEQATRCEADAQQINVNHDKAFAVCLPETFDFMANNINRITLTGNLTSDPEVTYLASGTATCTTRIACNRSRPDPDNKGQWIEETDFVPLKALGRTAETMATHASKGLKVTVEGRFTTDEWEDKETKKKRRFSYIFVTHFEPSQWKPKAEQAQAQTGDLDDDIPF